ncbi:hypothetical protein ACJQWK_01934 [Exserohilum turcicum]
MKKTPPWKGIYALGAVGFELLRFPYFVVAYLVASRRQNPTWSFRQAIGVRFLASALWHVATLQLQEPLPLTPGAEKERFVLVKPGKDEAYKGPLRNSKDVVPAEIGGTWYPAPLTPGSDKSNVKVILHTHGGAFVHGDGRSGATGFLTSLFLKHTPATHVFCPQYRLAKLPVSSSSDPFPAGLQDVVTSYLYLVHDLKVPAENIIVSGDSAGGNLTISLLRYIAEFGAEAGLPSPAAGLLWSPWIDTSDNKAEYARTNRNYMSDYLSPPFTVWATEAYAGPAGESVLSQPYVCHKNSMFKTQVPIWINTGGAEILYFDDVEWAEQMKKAGNNVELDIEDNVPHDIILLGNTLGFEKEAVGMAERVGKWIKEYWA